MFYFLLALILSLVLTFFVGRVARYFDIIDKPDNSRHWHKQSIPLLGGVAIFLSFWIILVRKTEKLTLK